jgi:hypothetical protein
MAGFFDTLFALFFGFHSQEGEKKRRMKYLVKDLAKNKYARFYKAKNEEISGALGKVFYDMYKIITPAAFLKNLAKSEVLKHIVAESFLSRDMEELLQRLSAEYLTEQAKTVALDDLRYRLERDLAMLAEVFGNSRMDVIDRCYNNILLMADFAAFDFFFVVRKFAPTLREGDFSIQPIFGQVWGSYLSDALKDFLEVAFALDPDHDWKPALQSLKIFRNDVEIVEPEKWNNLLTLIRDIRGSGILEMMIRHIDGDPAWQFSKPKLPNEKIAATYVAAKRAEVMTAMKKIENSQKRARITALAQTVFGNVDIRQTLYYTESASAYYVGKNFEGFTCTSAINYLKAFLMDFCRVELREIGDLVLIRGQWSTPELSQTASGHFYRLVDLADEVCAFDESFSDEGEWGYQLRTSVVKAGRNKSYSRIVEKNLAAANEAALNLVKTSLDQLNAITMLLKELDEDSRRQVHELIINWQELANYSKIPLPDRLSAACGKTRCFCQVMQYFANGEEDLRLVQL